MNPASGDKPKPNFFIIGAPKCGTTALSEYLSTHPALLFSRPKEPKYFHTDFSDDHRYARTLEEYLQCFDKAKMASREAVGEGTVWYLYSRYAVPNILEFNPSARFIVMIRDPIEIAYSLHSQLLFGGYENERDFEKAWRLQEARSRGESVPRACPDPKLLLYGKIAKIGEQIDRLLGLVASERVKILDLEDLRRDPASVYGEALDFLGLPSDGRQSFPAINRNRQLKSFWMARLFYLGNLVKRKLGGRRSLGIWKAVSPLLVRSEKRQPLSSELKAELRSHFTEDLERLSRSTGRDLSRWSG